MTPLIDFIGVINPDSLKVTPKINVLTIEEIEISIPHCNFSEESRSFLIIQIVEAYCINVI